MKKCDVIIPVYKAPEWVKLCVYALCRNTNHINKIYLINDSDDKLTSNCLNNLSNKYSCIEVIQNDKNMGFIKTCNRGMNLSKADYVLLLNTDCIINSRTIEKLINHLKRDNNIGLICPISSNAANLTLDIFPGFSYNDMDRLLEKKFNGKCFDACTVVGNCLMITRECINKIGYLDESYGMGYGEETDYQFKAMKAGFKAKVAIDTYVFHKSEVSFGISKEKQERLKHNQDLFFSRWKNDYYKLMEEYQKNDPIEFIKNNISEDDKKISFEFLIYLIGFNKAAGGINMTVDMINYLVVNNISCNILYGFSNGYDEIMLFNPILIENIDKYTFKRIVSTIYFSNYYAKMIADKYDIPLISFAQGYEPFFENGVDYKIAELGYKLADKTLTISNYLKDKFSNTFNIKSDVICNGIQLDLLYKENKKNNPDTITIFCRNNYLKGDFIAIDLFKRITNEYKNLNINLLYIDKNLEIPFYDETKNNVKLIKGPFTRKELANILINSDIYIDTSLTEGFGLIPLEAMASGNVVIASDSGGVREYIENNKNGFIVDKVNDTDCYLEQLNNALDKNKYLNIKKNMLKTVKNYDIDNVIEKYIDYFNKDIVKKNNPLNTKEKIIYDEVLDKRFRISGNKRKKIIYKIGKKVPKSLRNKIKRFAEKLYNFTNDH
ncbi:MAG: glycosyltransferase [Bacilli bacterium]|nr:glycosyltransferase [Bacilli bacterium]